MEHTSKSGRTFRATIVAEPKRDGKYIKGGAVQLLLDLCSLHEKPAPKRPVRKREDVLQHEIEARGYQAIRLMGEDPPKRPVTEWLVYESMGGERLATQLRGLTAAEAAYVRHVTLDKTPGNRRVVVWPSQVYAEERARERTAALRAEMDAACD